MKMSWLWFLPVLFITCVLNYPVLAWTQRRVKDKPMELKEDGKIIASWLAIMSFWLVPEYFILGDDKDKRLVLLATLVLFCT